MVHPSSLGHLGEAADARASARLMAAAPFPEERVLMLVPVGGRVCDRLGELLAGREAPALAGERAENLPPGLDQIEVGGTRGVKTNSQRGWASENKSTSLARWTFRLSRI